MILRLQALIFLSVAAAVKTKAAVQEMLAKEGITEEFHAGSEPRRIVGGTEADEGPDHWQFYVLFSFKGFRCGGALIADQWVLTAAHCIEGYKKGEYYNYNDCATTSIRIGSYYSYEGGQTVKCDKIIMHESWNKGTATGMPYDIALVHLTKRMRNVPAIALPYDFDVTGGDELMVGGLGDLEEDGDAPSEMRKIKLYAVSHSDCEDLFPLWWGSEISKDHHICASGHKDFLKPGIDACQGDSGGPLWGKYKVHGEYRQVVMGIVSWGDGCARKDKPGVYARVYNYIEWILFHTSQSIGGHISIPGDSIDRCWNEPNWADIDGDDCQWYTDMYWDGDDYCNEAEEYKDSNGKSARNACCICGGGDRCEDYAWEDRHGQDCQDYKGNGWCDENGPNMDYWFFYDRSKDGLDAREACCECGGGHNTAPPTPAPSIPPTAVEATGCADEGGKCACYGDVYYGRKYVGDRRSSFDEIQSVYVMRENVNGNVDCTNVAMLHDPLPGQHKTCFCLPDSGEIIARCGDRCTFYMDVNGLAWRSGDDCSCNEHLNLGFDERARKTKITKLDPNIFKGATLANIKHLTLSKNALTELPATLFSELTALEELDMVRNQLAKLPKDLFNGLVNLKTIKISDNLLSGLDAKIFNGLHLEHMEFERNKINYLDAEIFKPLHSTLQSINMGFNELTELSPTLFHGLTALERVWLWDNQLSKLNLRQFEGLSALEDIDLTNNPLTTLPRDIFQGLPSLKEVYLELIDLTCLLNEMIDPSAFEVIHTIPEYKLQDMYLCDRGSEIIARCGDRCTFHLDMDEGFAWRSGDDCACNEHLNLGSDGRASGAKITKLDPNIFKGATLSNIKQLTLYDNALTELPATLFSELTALEEIDMERNKINYLHSEIFKPLHSTLQTINMGYNELTELSPTLFDGLTALETVWLLDNQLSQLNLRQFQGLSALQEIDLTNNPLTTLPRDIFQGLPSLEFVYLELIDLTCLLNEMIDPSVYEVLHTIDEWKLQDMYFCDREVYEYGGSEYDTCPKNYKSIKSTDECKTAAVEMGKGWYGETGPGVCTFIRDGHPSDNDKYIMSAAGTPGQSQPHHLLVCSLVEAIEILDQAVFDLDAEGQGASGKIVDSAGGLEFAGGALVNDGTDRAHFDLTSGPLERTAGSRTETSKYSHAYLLKWRASDSGWRTLLRHSHDHCAIVQSGTKNLGVYANRGGQFRDSGYDITPNQDRWELLVVTGESTNGAVGTSTFWVEGQNGVMTSVGTSDRVCSGMDYYRVGWFGQNPGKVARILAWDRVLSSAEIRKLHASLVSTPSPAEPQNLVEIKPRDGLCLDANNKNEVHMWPCDRSNRNQQWIFAPEDREIKSVLDDGLCLAAPQRSTAGAQLYALPCNGGADQQWSFDESNGRIKNVHGICLDASHRHETGGRVHMWDCDDRNENQIWQVNRHN